MRMIVYFTEGNLYEQYEKKYHLRHNMRCIDNTITGRNKCVGYCKCNRHTGFLTDKLRKEHNCVGKQCAYYVAKSKKVSSQLSLDVAPSVLAMLQQMMQQDECVRVIRVENIEFRKYNAYYVSITNECDFDKYITQIDNELNVDVNFVNLHYNFDKCVALLLEVEDSNQTVGE